MRVTLTPENNDQLAAGIKFVAIPTTPTPNDFDFDHDFRDDPPQSASK